MDFSKCYIHTFPECIPDLLYYHYDKETDKTLFTIATNSLELDGYYTYLQHKPHGLLFGDDSLTVVDAGDEAYTVNVRIYNTSLQLDFVKQLQYIINKWTGHIVYYEQDEKNTIFYDNKLTPLRMLKGNGWQIAESAACLLIKKEGHQVIVINTLVYLSA